MPNEKVKSRPFPPAQAITKPGHDDVLVRKLSIRITWLLLHTRLSANQVTIGGILVGVAGAFLAVFTYYLNKNKVLSVNDTTSGMARRSSSAWFTTGELPERATPFTTHSRRTPVPRNPRAISGSTVKFAKVEQPM